ncbi:MAG: hypothetical protein Q9197_006411 [Variospora fuerteventurae]
MLSSGNTLLPLMYPPQALHLIIISPKSLTLLPSRTTNVLAAPPQNRAFNSSAFSSPYGPPPEPWNERTCRNTGLYPNMHLTFSWGTTVSRSALVSLVYTSKRTLGTIIRDGHGAWALAPGFGYFIVPKHGLLLVARPYQEKDFTYQQIYEAVDLLQLCGPDRGFRDEMWAYVFVEEARVGYVSIQMGWRPDDESTAITADMAIAQQGLRPGARSSD